MAEGDASSTRPKTALRTALWLAAFVALAFTLRTAFNVDAGFDAASDRHLFTGNDPYYDWHSIEYTLRTGQNLDYDHSVNYPEGRANPNPPLYDWTTLPLAAVLQEAGVPDPTGTALNVMVAAWAALTVLPVFLIGRDVFGRKAGLWAAFFMAVSAPHIQRTAWGYPRHEAIALFFIVLAVAFLVRAFKTLDGRDLMPSWRGGPAVSRGLRDTVLANRTSLAYAALAGLALTACANTWKGYPYALAIMAVGLGLQLVANHLRGRDATAVALVYLVAAAIAVFLPWVLVYQHFPNFLATTVTPSLYVLLGMLVASLLLVPTRNLPSILVFPALLLAGLVGLLVLLVVFPKVGHIIFSGLGYFSQSKLYGTIAEAQRPRLGEVAANFGFFAFLVAFWGFARAVRGAFKADASSMLVVAWAVVALFMTFAASRFLMNAAPVMSLFIGYAIMRTLQRIGGEDVRRRFRSAHGTGLVSRSLRSLSWKSVVGVALVAIFLVLPNVWIGVDAGMSTSFEVKHGLLHGDPEKVNRFGAFGIDFELKSNGWLPSMAYLAKQDTCRSDQAKVCSPGDPDFLPLVERPAFVAWWDYGHWAVGIGDHPTVADPFQSHYELAGRVLASDSEREAMAWLSIHLLNGDVVRSGGRPSAGLTGFLQANAPNLTQMPWGSYDAQYRLVNQTFPGDTIFTFYDKVCDATRTCVGYLAVDSRMYPFDDPRTRGIDRQSIFYAPVFLANKNPDDYMKVQFSGSIDADTLPRQVTLTMHRYAVDANGNSYELPAPRYVEEATQREWVESQGYAFPPGETPLQGYPASHGLALFNTESMEVTPRFGNTLFARAFGGLTDETPAGDGLSHWRVVQETLVNSTQPGLRLRDVVLLQYYRGATVTGELKDEAGQPLAGYTVAFQDASGATHGDAATGSNGRFTVVAPFAQDNDLKLVVKSPDGTIVHSKSGPEFQFTRQQASSGARLDAGTVTVARGSLLGHVFVDEDGDGLFGANDTALGGATVRVAGQTTTSDAKTGTYGLTGIQPGSYTLTATLAGYGQATQGVTVSSGGSTTVDVAMSPLPASVKVTVLDRDGSPLASVPVAAQPGTQRGTTNGTGEATLSLSPGTYQLTVDTNVTKDGQVVHYQARGEVTVRAGDNDLAVTLRVQ
ncbi:MAG TPA: carboxypeptidase regulatory-like domain-containing protein [Candidatus Thermoplasmatota archaeon]|nr:carboxypeptidase regulatory-like domain-containing protein [Candidatus Thermoplasmatota archaeon]